MTKTDSQIKKLHRSMITIKSDVDAQQKLIKSGEKPKILVEQFVSNEKDGAGGTIDLLVLYSDNSAAIYDYKFKGTNGSTSKWNKKTREWEGPDENIYA